MLDEAEIRFRPLTGRGSFLEPKEEMSAYIREFPSPYGAWVVSAKLHILFGTAGKRIVNFAVLLYHIDRQFINSKLRKREVPCEAYKKAAYFVL